MTFDHPGNVVRKVFNCTGIDMLKLRRTKDWRIILRMMRIANDITLSPGVNFMLEFCPESANLDVIKSGLFWHFMRWNSSVAAEALTSVIEPLGPHKNSSNQRIWILIESQPHILENWNQIQSYLVEKDHRSHLKHTKMIRDKLFAHYDTAPINKAFNTLLDLHEQAGDEVVLGWHMQSSNDGGLLTRNNMIDQLLNIAWFQEYSIEPTISGPNMDAINELCNSLQLFFSLISNFTHSVVIAYLEYHDLINIDGEPPWYAKERSLHPRQ